jgi:imidazolonepropionase-like amidohydrolase
MPRDHFKTTGTHVNDTSPDLIIHDVSVIDVERGVLLQHQDVAIAGRYIQSVEPTGTAQSPDARVVDGRSRYLLPGLIDCHVHVAFNGFLGVESDFRRTLKQFLVHGVTTAVDFFTAGGTFPGSSAETVRDDVNSGAIEGPWLLTSYGCLNAPGGFCSCSVGDAAFEVVTMDDVHRHLERITCARPDFVKIVYDDVFGTLPNLTPDLLAELIRQVHERGYRAAVHIATVQDAHEAVSCGADILGHGITGAIPPALAERMAQEGTVVIPTLSSYEARSLLRQRIVLPPFSPPDSVSEYQRQTRSIYEDKGLIGAYAEAFNEAADTVVPLLEAGVRVVAGSDSGTWYTFPGDALHRELQIYNECGVTPAAALRMATVDAARAFGLDDRFGRITPGLEASLLLLDENPLTEIHATRSVCEVFFRGEQLDLDRLRAEITAPNDVPARHLSDIPCSPHHLRVHA